MRDGTRESKSCGLGLARISDAPPGRDLRSRSSAMIDTRAMDIRLCARRTYFPLVIRKNFAGTPGAARTYTRERRARARERRPCVRSNSDTRGSIRARRAFPRRTQPLLAFSTRPFFFSPPQFPLLTLFTVTCRHERNEEHRCPRDNGTTAETGEGGWERLRARARAQR